MQSYRLALQSSWVKKSLSARALAQLLGISLPTSVAILIKKLAEPETIHLQTDVVTPEGFPLGGRVDFMLRSDGGYTFEGNMRATGLTSYHFGLQVFVHAPDGVVIAAQRTGSVFGTDTPGERSNSWSENATSSTLIEHWESIRSNPVIGYNLKADIGGILGTGWDLVNTVVKAIVANAALGVGGLIIILGSELTSSLGVRVATPDKFLGVVVAGGIIVVAGVGIMFPAIVAGSVVAALSDIKHRSMTDEERAFATKVFMDKIPFDRITLTNMSHDGGGAYTIPTIDGSILVNLDDAPYDNPTTYSKPRSDYSQPGSLFIHELTHAWQIANTSFVPGLICDVSSNYSYHSGGDDESHRLGNIEWSSRPWSGFTLEQQAHIVDDWYGAFWKDLASFGALNDPAFHFIVDNIRAGKD
jgi:hypothetical protein